MDANGFGEWGGYMDAKITKLEEQFSAASNPYKQTDLFDGISIYVNGLTNPSADELKRIMMVHGGIYHHYERSHTTYIIASNLPDVKVRNMDTSKIISPQWVVDCVREKRILDYTRYLLYTNQKTTQPRLTFKKQEKLQPMPNSSMSSDQTPQDIKPSSGSSAVARTAVDPKFLSEFYNNSRLHHIATLGAGFKQYVGDLREKHGQAGFPARTALKEELLTQGVAEVPTAPSGGCVMHIDMDCFFVSVGLRTHPELRGQPVAVTHSKGGSSATEVPVHPGADRRAEMELFAQRFEQHLHSNILSDKVRSAFDSKMSLSEIASCSYEARAKGIRNGMFMGQALKLCPELKAIPYDFEGYREVAYTLYDTIAQYTLNIEAVSCDEMFVELTDVLSELKVAPMDFVSAIRDEVRRKTGCPCSAGVGANKLQARMATKRAKPDGQYELNAADVETYMTDIPIKELPGVGSNTEYTLKEANLLTCGDMQKVSLLKIQMHVGKKFGETLFKFCRGIDDRPLVYGQIRKSVSAEVNYGIRFKEYTEVETFLRQLCTEVHTRLTEIKRRTKCITLKVMVRSPEAPVETAKFMGHGVCDHITKSVSLSEFTCELEVITRTVLTTMKALALPPQELRGMGIQLTKLDNPNEAKERKENVIMNLFSKVVEKKKEAMAISESGESTTSEVKEVRSAPPLNEAKPKRSPNKNTKTSPAKRGRSSTTAESSTQDGKKRADIKSMFQSIATKKKTNNSPPKNNTTAVANAQLPAEVDAEVLAALPEEIRKEVLATYGISNTSNQQQKFSEASNVSSLNESDLLPSTSRAAAEKRENKNRKKASAIEVDAEFMAALPEDLRKEIEMDIAEQQKLLKQQTTDMERENQNVNNSPKILKTGKQKISDDNIFMQSNCIELLLAWVKSDEEPQDYDIGLIGQHACELVAAKEIDKLYDPLLYLCRLINSQKNNPKDCAWHLAYVGIIEAVQTAMQQFYDGNTLFLGANLKCQKCLMHCS